MSQEYSTQELNLRATLEQLAVKRPLFHSEADFQFALAWEIQQAHPDYRVRLEWPIKVGVRRAYIDLLVTDPRGQRTAVELKYWTRKQRAVVAGERFELASQAAQDTSRYDFWKDVARLEQLARSGVIHMGLAIALTNDLGYWRQGRAGTADEALRVHDGRDVSGTLSWGPAAGPGTTKGCKSPITLDHQYRLSWREYAAPDVDPRFALRYLLLEIG